MKRKALKVSLSIIVGIVCAILVAVCVCAIIANSKNDKSEPHAMLASWQDAIEDDALLKEVVIAGAHDAGTKGMPYYVATQDRTVDNLLLCGTRYFDLRVSYTNGKLCIFHGPSHGIGLDGILDGVSEFLKTHKSETVILDFQHFENGDEAQPRTIRAVEQKLAGLLVSNDGSESDMEFIDKLTIGKARGKALVVWGTGNRDILSKNYVFQRNNDGGTRVGSVLHSYYQTQLNTKSSSNYISEALPLYIGLYKSEGCGLFVLQGQLTDGMYIFGPHLREATHTDNMNEFVKNLETDPDLQLINIIMRDFVSPKKNCLTLRLNITKGIVKQESLTDFSAMLQAHLVNI